MVLRFAVALSVVALLVLAGLQYHWIGQIAVAERQRLERSVAQSSRELADDFASEFRNLGNALEPRFFPVSLDASLVATRYLDWAASAGYPDLVRTLYLVRSSDEVLRFNATTGVFEPDESPSNVTPLAQWLLGPPGPLSVDSDFVVLFFNRRFPGPRGLEPPREGPNGADRLAPDGGWIVMELNHSVIVDHILPRLVARRFTEYEGQDYRVAVTASQRGSKARTVFTSGDPWTENDIENPDYSMELLTPQPLQRRGNGPPPPGAPPQRGGRGERGRGPDPRGPVVTLAGQSWRLLVKHRAGSVETAVESFRARNLALSFGVLVVLGISAVAIVISSARARRLGRLQMEFAAGISHELRTPLAVIQSAAHNLGSGVVQDRQDIQEYAAIVGSEARRLTEMVEQVMAYTETQSGGKAYAISPIDLHDVVEIVLRNMGNVLREGNAVVQNKMESRLPLVMADAAALTRCLQNLLSNAIKYGQRDGGATIEIYGRTVSESGSVAKVELNVVDHGTGVPDADVKYLFEPFHRGSNANTNTPGNGLGLHLVERIMKAQSGAVTYHREPDGGARFTLTLQAVAEPV